MIFDGRNWRDSLKNFAINLTDTANGLLAFSTFPVACDRIVAIRCNGDHILFPIDSPLAMQLDPTVFERSDMPLAYEDFSDEAGLRFLRFLPKPKTNPTPLLIVGKRTLVNLVNDGDTPIIRNIDNALIAFVTSDMLERQRQYGKAQAKVQEAASLLQELVKLEEQDAGNIKRIIPVVEPDPFWSGDFLTKDSFA
jgi:hypothetical protein